MAGWLVLIISSAPLNPLCGLSSAGSGLCTEGGLSFRVAIERAEEVSFARAEATAGLEASEAQRQARVWGLLPRLIGRASFDYLSDVDNPPLAIPRPDGVEAEIRADIGQLGDPAAQSLWNRSLNEDRRAQSFAFPVVRENTAVESLVVWSLKRNLLTAAHRLGAASASVDASGYAVQAARRDVRLQAAVSYLTVVVAKGREIIADASLRRSERVEGEVESRARNGLALRSDLLRVRAQTARFAGIVAEARNARVRAVRQFRTLLQLEAGDDIALAVDVNVIGRSQTLSFSDALELALAQRPELQRAAATTAAADSVRDATFWEMFPDLEVSASLRYARPNPRVVPPVDEFRTDWRVGAMLSWSPTDTLETLARESAAAAEARRSRIAIRRLEDEVRREVAEALEDLETALAMRESASAEQRAAEESYRVQRRQYSAGVTTLGELIESESELVAAELRAFNAAVRIVLAREQLMRATGSTEPAQTQSGVE